MDNVSAMLHSHTVDWTQIGFQSTSLDIHVIEYCGIITISGQCVVVGFWVSHRDQGVYRPGCDCVVGGVVSRERCSQWPFHKAVKAQHNYCFLGAGTSSHKIGRMQLTISKPTYANQVSINFYSRLCVCSWDCGHNLVRMPSLSDKCWLVRQIRNT